MNGKTARKLRKLAGYDPSKEVMYKHMRRSGRTIRGTQVATGARNRYQQLKKALKNGQLRLETG